MKLTYSSSIPLTQKCTAITALWASLEVASLPEHGLRAGDVLKAADDALYQAKVQGRNQVVATVPAVKVVEEAAAPLSREIS